MPIKYAIYGYIILYNKKNVRKVQCKFVYILFYFFFFCCCSIIFQPSDLCINSVVKYEMHTIIYTTRTLFIFHIVKWTGISYQCKSIRLHFDFAFRNTIVNSLRLRYYTACNHVNTVNVSLRRAGRVYTRSVQRLPGYYI